MKKYNKLTVILTTLLCLLPIVAGVILWDKLPDRMAIHFNAANEPDGWASKPFAVVGMPAIIAAIHLACLFITAQDPKKQNITGVMKTLMLWICPFISWLCAGMTIGYALESVRNIGVVVCVFLGILFMVIGNYLPKCLPSYTVGIKLPWTLHDEGNWRYTHRIGGFCDLRDAQRLGGRHHHHHRDSQGPQLAVEGHLVAGKLEIGAILVLAVLINHIAHDEDDRIGGLGGFHRAG
jgi:uncharacterized membrane protein